MTRIVQVPALVVCALGAVLHAQPAFAALTITKTSWNVVGLDSNDVSAGPNVFPVAVVVCNTGPTAVTNLTTTFVWDSSNALINLTGPAVINRGGLAAGSCLHAYYWAAVTRSAAAYTTTRRYHIMAAADGGFSASTPIRELYVERLIGQNRNTSLTPSGPTTVVVGQTYTYTWTGNTAPQGYEQVTNFIAFDDRIFRVLSAESRYSAGPSPVGGMYNDACGWNDAPGSAGYRTCTGTGKAGGTITMTVTVQIIGTGSTRLAAAIYDYSGSSFHYNSDFGRNALPVTAIAGSADLSITKTNGVSAVTSGSTTTYTVVVQNAGPNAADGAVVSDPAVSGLSKTGVSCSAANGAVCPSSLSAPVLESGVAIPVLPSGGTVTFTITALVTAASESVTNTATVTTPPLLTDPNLTNNSAADTDTIAPPSANQADLAITKTNFVTTLNPGGTTVYTVVVTNKGPNAVTGASVADLAPEGLTFGAWTCTGAGGAVCPPSGSGNLDVTVSLPAGSSATFQVNAMVNPTASGSVTNTARVTPPAGITDPNPGDNSASDTDTIASGPTQVQQIGIAKSAGTPQQIGPTTFEVAYTIIVTNVGAIAATNVQVTDALDTTFASGSPALSLASLPTASGIGGASASQCPVNSSFTGTGSATSLLAGNATLEPGQGCRIALTVRVAYATAASIPREPQLNTAVATTHATPGGDRIARDASDSGSDPAGTNPGAPGDTGGADDSTPVAFPAPSTPTPTPPVPPGPAEPPSVSVTKRASTAVAELGDAITYSVHIRNDAGASLPATTVQDRLPLGFSYVAGSARLTVGSTALRMPEPIDASTRVLVFAIPEQPLSEAVLVYQVRVSAGALQGDGTNCATVVAEDGTQSSTSCVRVLVSSSVFTQQACVIGKVFLDGGGGNRQQDAGEPGVPGVTLYLEDGTSVVTDAAGGFSYCGVRAGTRVLKVDRSTLPTGARLVPGSNRSALDAGSAFLDVKFGEVHRADFVIVAEDAQMLTEIEQRRARSQVRAPDADTTDPSEPPNTAATTETPLLAVGVLEAFVSLSSVRRPFATTARSGDVFDEDLRRFSRSFNDGKGVSAGRAAMFMQGTVRPDIRLSVSFDSERADRGVLFRDIQPDAFYPIYGDASRKAFAAQSSRRFYAKVERGKSYVLFGDLQTSRETPARDLGMYARTLTGVQHRFEKGNVVLNLFATRDTLRQVIDEFGARGTSGPYSVSNPNGVRGTEKVEIVTRDRNQPAIILSAQPLTRFLDYEFEPFSGRVLFRRPIASMDEHLNPVSIRITYEVDAGGDRHWIGGFDGRMKVAPRVELGGSWAQDRSSLAPYDLASVNATLTLGKQTTIFVEAARSGAAVNTNAFNRLAAQHLIDAAGDVDGNAARLELTHHSRGASARVYTGMSDVTFYNPSATLNGGRAEAGASASYHIRPGSQLRGELIRSNDRITGGTRQGGFMSFESKVRKLTFEGGVRHVRESVEAAHGTSAGLIQPFGTMPTPGFGFNPVGTQIDPSTGLPIVSYGSSSQLSAGRLPRLGQPVEATTIRARVASAFSKDWNAYLEGEQDVTDADKHMAAVGGQYRAAERAHLYLRHELISSLDGIYGLSNGQRSQRTVFGLSSAYKAGGELFSEYRMGEAISGREAQAAFGLRNAWKVREGVHLSTGLERLNPIQGVGSTATAASLGTEFTRSAHFKGTSRLEWRREGSNDNWLSTVGVARRLSRGWTMLAKNYYQLAHPLAAPTQLQDRFWVGTAYRDPDRNRQNLLSRYEFRFERLPQGDLGGTTIDRRVHVVSTHGDYRRSQPWTLSGQYAGKWVNEPLGTGSGRYAAHLLSGRTGYDLARRVDVGGLASVMWSESDQRLRKALGAEVGVLVVQNAWLSVGYNVTGFSDRDFNSVLSVDSTRRGFFVRLRLKFDEELFRSGDRR